MKTLLFMFIVLTIGCSTTHPLSDAKDTWVVDQYGPGSFIYYCKSHSEEKGIAKPICYRAQVFDRADIVTVIPFTGKN